MSQTDYNAMSPVEFEEFCFDLLRVVGFRNVDWRKGTPKTASPADGGRDIIGEIDRVDVDGHRHTERWFVDCKRYVRGVPPREVLGLLTWSVAERPHVALVIASGHLSNPCKDYLEAFTRNNHPPFRIRYWERPHLDKLSSGPTSELRTPAHMNELAEDRLARRNEPRTRGPPWNPRRQADRDAA